MKLLLAGQIENLENHAAILGGLNDVITTTDRSDDTRQQFPQHTGKPQKKVARGGVRAWPLRKRTFLKL